MICCSAKMLLSICVCTLLVSVPAATAQSGLRTEPSQQTQFYGNWNHPTGASSNATAPKQPSLLQPSINSDQFRKLFPPAQSKPFENHPTVGTTPPPRAEVPPRSRSLQPLPQPMLSGKFRDQSSVDSAMTSFESASEPVNDSMPAGETGNAWESQAEEMKDKASGMMDWISEKGQSTLEGMPGQRKDLLSKITGFIGGKNNPVRKVVGALALVIGGYLSMVWFSRKLNVGGDGRLPADVIEVLGVSPFGPRKNLQLVRLGSKLLLLMNGPEGTQPVGEITDPAEVEHLASLCNGRSAPASERVLGAIRNHGRSERTSRTPIAGVVNERSFSTSELMQALESLADHKSTRSYEV